MVDGNRLSDIGHAVQVVAEEAGFSVVRGYEGHAIGTAMHEKPGVPNYGEPGKGPKLRPGKVFAIEPMVNVGTHKTKVLDDGWSVVTADGSLVRPLRAHHRHHRRRPRDPHRALISSGKETFPLESRRQPAAGTQASSAAEPPAAHACGFPPDPVPRTIPAWLSAGLVALLRHLRSGCPSARATTRPRSTARFVPPEISEDDVVNEPKVIDEIIVGDSRAMTDVADASVALVVTSPPYFAGKEYEAALGEGHIPGSYIDYLQMLEDVFAECVRVLEPGGRIAVNVANLGRRPFRSLAADVTTILQDRLRLLLRGEIVWRKAVGASGSCAWGSFRSPTNPTLRDLTERVVVASKGRFDRAHGGRARRSVPDEFMDATLDVWDLPAESAKRVGHPAPFPVELPQR